MDLCLIMGKSYSYDPNTDFHAEIINKVLNSDKPIKLRMISYNAAEYLRKKLTFKFKHIAKIYKDLDEPFIKPIPHLMNDNGQYYIEIDRIDKRKVITLPKPTWTIV